MNTIVNRDLYREDKIAEYTVLYCHGVKDTKRASPILTNLVLNNQTLCNESIISIYTNKHLD